MNIFVNIVYIAKINLIGGCVPASLQGKVIQIHLFPDTMSCSMIQYNMSHNVNNCTAQQI